MAAWVRAGSPPSHCHGHTLARCRVPFVIAAAVLVQVPVHPGCLFVVDLHPIHADILDAAFRIAREHQRKRDEAPAVSGPALQNGQRVKIRFLNHFLTGGLVHLAGAQRAARIRSGSSFTFAQNPSRCMMVMNSSNRLPISSSPETPSAMFRRS